VAGLWLQDWAGKRVDSFGSRVLWNWELDTNFYPDWPSMLSEWSSRGVNVLAYINPCVSTRVGEFKPHARRDMFLEARDRGFLIRDAEGEPYVQSSASDEFQFGTVDLTMPDAREWYQAVVIECNLLCKCKRANKLYPPLTEYNGALVCGMGGEGVGVKGYMADFGEYLPYDVTLSTGLSGATAHNDWPRRWSSLNSDALEAANAKDVLYFSRSGGLRSPEAGSHGGMFWVGDQNTAWDAHDGLESVLTAYLTAGSTGFTLTHSDVGGYTSLDIEKDGERHTLGRTEELVLRWMELSAVADCMFRSHEGNQADKQLQVWDSERLTNAFGFWATFHSLLWPLKERLIGEAKNKGYPLVRGMWYDHGADKFGMNGQFMLGTQLLMKPVFAPGVAKTELWLPRGSWVDVWTCEAVRVKEEGGRNHTVDSPVGRPAMFWDWDRKDSKGFAKKVWKGLGMLDGEGKVEACAERLKWRLPKVFGGKGEL